MDNEEKLNSNEVPDTLPTVDAVSDGQINNAEGSAEYQKSDVESDNETGNASAILQENIDPTANGSEVNKTAAQTTTENTSSLKAEPIESFSDENEASENALNKNLGDLTLEERETAAIAVAEFFSELQQNEDFIKQLRLNRLKFSVLVDFDDGNFHAVISTVSKFTADQKNNIFAAYVLFYIISAGKYPQACWKGVNYKTEDTVLGEIRGIGKEFSLKFSKSGNVKLADKINEITKSFQRTTEDSDIAPLVRMEEGVGISKIYEMFWEVFVMKYGNYKPSFWQKKLTEFYGKKYVIRDSCEFKEQGKGVDIYAVSYEGKLNKPLHNGCEDCSFVTVYDENTWLAVSADGVGSCENSYLGSQHATEMLSETIAAYLQNNHILASDKKRRWLGNKLRPVNEETWARLMYFLRFELAGEFYDAWESAVKMSKEFAKAPDAEVSQFTSTLQFAFGCEKFIACGRVGDGSFFVRKKERTGNGLCYGGLLLDDCISGVMQSAVLTVAHLKTNPSALQVDFFRKDELTDIIISSDGVTSALGNTVEEVNKFACSMRELPFEERCKALACVARTCSDYNETQHGSGDDCTLVHIVFKD